MTNPPAMPAPTPTDVAMKWFWAAFDAIDKGEPIPPFWEVSDD